MGKQKLDDRVTTLYNKHFLSCEQIANEYGVSRVAVWKFLRGHGVDTSKHGGVETKCAQCGTVFKKLRCRMRQTMKDFCNIDCYMQYVRNDEYQDHRQGQRKARSMVSAVIYLQDEYTVHHVDGNPDNNPSDLSNHWVFKSNADHMRFHRGGKAKAFITILRKWQTVSQQRVKRQIIAPRRIQKTIADKIIDARLRRGWITPLNKQG